ncbi:hypothetical protein [Moellerella wisconsensis]|uniref:hypothetical protein n=1 Tax=Moellerella wisconsensis TaxID=158849 RepID=UPI00064153F5|nr:hypothetical protein [Moellerella wisconsensis]KLN95760.1 hypothetical protein VK86_13605 [Moellerella wisconsensis]
MRTFLISMMCVAMLSGCAATEYNYTPQSHKISEPKVGSVNTVTVGDTLIKDGNISDIEGIKIANLIKIDMAYKIIPGLFKKVGSNDQGDFYMPTTTMDSGSVVVEVLGRPWTSLLVKKEGKTNEICVVSDLKVAVCSDDAQIEKLTLNDPDSNSFEQALIFNGVNEDKVDISYQQIGSNIKNQNFGNNIQYNLKKSPIISYKGAQLEVLNSTDTSLTYKVISNFSNN